MKFDKATLRERFHVAQSEKAAVEAAVQPLIDQREALIAEMRPMQERLDALNEQLKDAREPLYELSVEIGAIARFLRDPDVKTRV